MNAINTTQNEYVFPSKHPRVMNVTSKDIKIPISLKLKIPDPIKFIGVDGEELRGTQVGRTVLKVQKCDGRHYFVRRNAADSLVSMTKKISAARLTPRTISYTHCGINYIRQESGGTELFQHIVEMKENTKYSYFLMSALVNTMRRFHTLGFVHRDIKPENILVGTRGFQFIDFEATMKEGDMFHSAVHRFGTPGYVAPETLGVEHCITAATDTYSLGACLWVMKYKISIPNHGSSNKLTRKSLANKVQMMEYDALCPLNALVCLEMMRNEPVNRISLYEAENKLKLLDEVSRTVETLPKTLTKIVATKKGVAMFTLRKVFSEWTISILSEEVGKIYQKCTKNDIAKCLPWLRLFGYKIDITKTSSKISFR